MGVPSLFAHLSTKYKSIHSKKSSSILCLDFNALVHNSNRAASTDESVIHENIKRYLESFVLNHKLELLYIAFDGVAPRAKLNQQRARRYLSADEVIRKGKRFFIHGGAHVVGDVVEEAIKAGIVNGGSESEIMGDLSKFTDHSKEISSGTDGKNNNEENKEQNNLMVDSSMFNTLNEDSTIKEQNNITNNLITHSKGNDPLKKVALKSSSFNITNDDLEDLNSSSDEEVWDSNSITPGTPFMNRLDAMLEEFFYMKLNTDKNWANITVIFSSSKIPGEGEQKIMHFIKSIKPASCMIYSPDADVIFLSMLLPCEVILMREDTSGKKCSVCDHRGHVASTCGDVTKTQYVFVDINELKRCVVRDMKLGISKQIKIERDYRLIYDFVLICSLCGNDFIPSLPCFDVRFGAIESLTEIIVSVYNRFHKFIVTEDKKIDFNVLREVFIQLAKKENNLYTSKVRRLKDVRSKWNIQETESIDLTSNRGRIEYYRKKLFKEVKLENNKNVEQCYKAEGEGLAFNSYGANNQPSQNNALCNDNVRIKGSLMQNQNKSFSETLFDNDFINDRHKVAVHYLTGISWIFALYFDEHPSWSWFYPYHYAPFADDLAMVTDFQPIFEYDEPLSMYEQCLLVQPSLSKHNLPPSLHSFYEINNCPSNIKIDMFDKLLPWQGVALIPFEDVNKVKKIFNALKPNLSNEEIKENIFGTEIMFIGKVNKEFKNCLGVFSKDRIATKYGTVGKYWYGKSLGEIINGRVNDALCVAFYGH